MSSKRFTASFLQRFRTFSSSAWKAVRPLAHQAYGGIDAFVHRGVDIGADAVLVGVVGHDVEAALFLLLAEEVGAHQADHGHQHEDDGHHAAALEQGPGDQGAGAEGAHGGQEPAADDSQHAGDAVDGALTVPGAVGEGGAHGHHEGHIGGGQGQLEGRGRGDEDAGDHQIDGRTHLVEGQHGRALDLLHGPHAAFEGGEERMGQDLVQGLAGAQARAHDEAAGQGGAELFPTPRVLLLRLMEVCTTRWAFWRTTGSAPRSGRRAAGRRWASARPCAGPPW